MRGPNLFTGYLNRPDATAEAMRDGWFRTGDLATRRRRTATGGSSGARATDLIKTGGYKVGAGEVEVRAARAPAASREAAVTGEPDDGPRRADRRLGRAADGEPPERARS